MKLSHAILLDNIRSVFNVGAIFRTADTLGVGRIYLTGYTPGPVDRFGRARKDFHKVALGAEHTVKWENIVDPEKLIVQLKAEGVNIVALEQAPRSIDYKTYEVTQPTLFILGNEVEGVSRKLLEVADTIIEIPMAGKKESLNVAIAAGVVLFRLLDK